MSTSQPNADQTMPATGATQIRTVSRAEAARGIVCHFSWRGDDLQAEGDISRGELGLVMSRVEISTSAATGVTHNLLRRVPLGDVLRAVNTTNLTEPQMVALASGVREVRKPSGKSSIPPGRVHVTDDLLQQVALAYLQESAPGKDRAVLQRLEEHFGRPKGTIRTWLKRARDDGWLGAAVQGRMGAEPGPKLLAALDASYKQEKALIEKWWPSSAFRYDPTKTGFMAAFQGAITGDDVQEIIEAALKNVEIAAAQIVSATGDDITPVEVATIAQRLWGESLTAHHERLVAEQDVDAQAAMEQLLDEVRRVRDHGWPTEHE